MRRHMVQVAGVRTQRPEPVGRAQGAFRLRRHLHEVDVQVEDRRMRIGAGRVGHRDGAFANGQRLEDALAARGLTLGHFPSSIYCSTLGGWLAARSAGQLSNRYGKIEDMVRGLSLVSGRGELLELGTAGRASAGPDWLGLVVGSEGTLGVITRARLRVLPAPAVRHLRGFAFADVPGALAVPVNAVIGAAWIGLKVMPAPL